MENLDQTIAQIRAGNSDLYGKIVDEFEGKVRAVVAAMIPDPNRIPDMTQEVFITAYRRLDSYRPGTNFPAWLSTIARNVAQNERRRWYRQREKEAGFKAEAIHCVEPQIDRVMDDMPEDTLDALKDCVSRLQGKSQDVMQGFYYKDQPLVELADRLRITENSVKVILHRARQAIGSCLQKKGRCHV
ncbi:MAG: sigma-70 family RNA polymerase sigma factor [bacterium]